MSVESIATRLEASGVSEGIRSVSWIIPLSQAIHIVAIGLVFVSVLMIALRVLGWVRTDESLAKVWARFAPFLWGGLIVLLLTGIVQTMGEPIREIMALSFRIKMLLLVIGVAGAAAFGRSVRAAVRAGSAPAHGKAPAGTRLGAVVTVVLWLCIVFLGRAIAYDNSVWGKWSPAVQQGGGQAK